MLLPLTEAEIKDDAELLNHKEHPELNQFFKAVRLVRIMNWSYSRAVAACERAVVSGAMIRSSDSLDAYEWA